MKASEITEDMITAAVTALDTSTLSVLGVSRQAVAYALGAAIEAAPEPEMAAVISDHARAPWLLIVMNDLDADGFGIQVHAAGLPDEEAIRALLVRIVGEMTP